MPDEPLSVALEREHHDIDRGIAAFIENQDAEALTTALDALRRHIYLEEVLLFPPVRQGGLVMPIFVMTREHGEIWHTMDALDTMLSDGSDAEPLRETCRRLLAQLELHNMKEEPVIYPHADTGLPPETGAELARFLQSGSMPDAWVCQQA